MPPWVTPLRALPMHASVVPASAASVGAVPTSGRSYERPPLQAAVLAMGKHRPLQAALAATGYPFRWPGHTWPPL
ncbi:hypothetical protein B296_00043856 [Ensete ventricosum]|uniref:Uncharacterized protein n=1 Tax=Ensete ventricosum TaxID=4639 RepID=A0A426YTT9_ENSVE|nr:hypothetical protein B296_00043856 [Ensete ventricosum]